MSRGDPRASSRLIFILTAVAAVIGFIVGGEVIRVIYTKEMRNMAAARKDVVQSHARVSPCEYAPIPGAPDPEYNWFSGFPEGRVLGGRRENAIVRAARRVAPSVVGIVVTQIQVVRSPESNDFFDFFLGSDTRAPIHRQIENAGSGFIIREDGMILTNYHVIRNASRLYINFPDGSRAEGQVVGADEKSDIAVIAPVSSPSPGRYKPVEFGNSDDCLVGEWSIALGNPFLNFINDAFPTLTLGVISALNRDFAPSKGVYYRNMIQTDAPINQGNSGGPLLNANAEVIGVNSFIYTGSSVSTGSVGMGFAIPINRARRVAEELIAHGHRRQIWTGLVVRDINEAISSALNYDGSGVAVMSIIQRSPGDSAGIKPGDVIRKIDDRTIHGSSDLDGFFLDYFAGDTAEVQFVRDGKPSVVNLVLREVRVKK